ncbi:proline-, glutamic acid- and leucine-rich 1 [Olea europaea subsp. europaea]|uniref:Proline-, glutamic acid- and leucine-rich 1 n=2 Tax=Olea europaea subsp. europaea TaxID=158383 RepID=A0A8S0TH57_OLEEU|nr:proline-, glutamic acid- and leucine-rich 1 [Olea europaea subsp. europaea]
MDDILKPKLLRLLLREYVPDERHPFRNSLELLFVVSSIKTHKLLSEWAPKSTNKNLIDEWKSAVDSWVNRVFTIASSNMPDKCWAGICLLGLTCQECSPERFLASYSDWFSKLLSLIQTPADSHFVKAASCASISDLLIRLSGFPNTKKDGTSQATKLIQPVLKLLDEDSSDGFSQEALCLLCTIMNCFPHSVHRNHGNIEAAILLKIMSGKCSASILKKLGNALCLLPKSKGDEDSWSLLMQKILLSINNQLNDAFQGLEEEARSNETMRILLPPGKEAPQPLGGQERSQETSDFAMRRAEQLLVSRISTLMYCCCTMLTDSYPVQVTVPVRAVVSLVGRVLMVDGSLSQASYPSMTAMKQELICSELPILQLHSLEMLSAIIKGLRSQLSPHVAEIIQLLAKYFGRCRLPMLREKAYAILKVLLSSMGVGVAIHLSQDVVTNAFIDLESFGDERKGTSFGVHANASRETLTHSRRRKRKQASMTESLQDQLDRDNLEVAIPQNPAELSVKVAALEALEALLTVGGSLRSESWRANVDHLLITVATNACKGGWAKEERSIFLCDEPIPIWADFQLASLRALLASLLSPGRVRPPYLSLGLELFRRGMQETGSRLSEYCRHALLALEVLIHPRALSLVDFSTANDNYEDLSRKVPENVTFQIRTLGKGIVEHESDDELYKNWLGSDDEMEEVPDTERNTNYTAEPSAAARSLSPVNLPNKSELRVSSSGANEKIAVDRDDVMVELQETNSTGGDKLGEHVPNTAAGDYPGGHTSRVVSNSDALDPMDTKMAPVPNDTAMISDAVITAGRDENAKKNVSGTKDGGFNTIIEKISATLVSNFKKSEGLTGESDNESLDSIPDIIEGDPDSD